MKGFPKYKLGDKVHFEITTADKTYSEDGEIVVIDKWGTFEDNSDVETNNDIFIFEFKLDGSAEEALKQIEEQQYAVPYLNDKRKLHKIGVNISSASRTVDAWLVSE